MPPRRRWILLLPLLFLGVQALTLWLAPARQPAQLERIRAAGELVIATRHSPAVWYEGADGPAGPEHDLAAGLARALGVTPRFVFPATLPDLLDDARHGRVHLAAAGLTVSPEWHPALRFGAPFAQTRPQLVYRMGHRRPRDLREIDAPVHVTAGSAHEARLRALARRHANLRWIAHRDRDPHALLAALERGEIAHAVADADELRLASRIYRHLAPAFDLGPERPRAWAFPPFGDDSLIRFADRYLERLRADGRLERIMERYYGHAARLGFVDKRAFLRAIRDRLPALRPFFELAARQTGIDWRLLAAIAYQESHWNPKAVSPTGVRGIMMLTRDTARELGISDRLDPEQSILGGARYLRIVERKIPERIPEPDRLWLTLAGYNIGFGHLEDARVLTQREGGDPDRWRDVRRRLPLLNLESMRERLRYGNADGRQAVAYVENIRNYHDLLVWYDNHPEDLRLELATE